MIAWAKQDPVRTDIDIPSNIKQIFRNYDSVLRRYGKVLYGIFSPTYNREAATELIKAFLDLMFEERGILPLTSSEKEYEKIREIIFHIYFLKYQLMK